MWGFGSSKLRAGRKYKVRVSVGTAKLFGGLKVWDFDAMYIPDEGETEDDAKAQMSEAAFQRWEQNNGRRPRDLCVVGFSMHEM